jgi:hypothetical protein
MKILGFIIFFAVIPVLGLLASPLLGICGMIGMFIAAPLAPRFGKYLAKGDDLLEQAVTDLTRQFIARALMGIPAGAALFVDAYLMHRWFGTSPLLLLILIAVAAPFLDTPGSVTAIPTMFAMYWLFT